MLRKNREFALNPAAFYTIKTNKHKRMSTYTIGNIGILGWVFNTPFKKFEWGAVLGVEKNGVHRENHGPATSHWQTLSHNVVSPELDSNS